MKNHFLILLILCTNLVAENKKNDINSRILFNELKASCLGSVIGGIITLPIGLLLAEQYANSCRAQDGFSELICDIEKGKRIMLGVGIGYTIGAPIGLNIYGYKNKRNGSKIMSSILGIGSTI